MTITTKVIADNISPQNIPLTTLQLRYPRFIHAELMTHRVFSRNASSSRAVPVKKLIEDIQRDPAMPIHWGKNQPGMQAREEHDAVVNVPSVEYGPDMLYPMNPESAWLEAMERAISVAEAFDKAGYHKQIVNRLLEPFSHINVVVTSTDWNNFFALRRHPDAQPEIKILADAIWDAMEASTSKLLQPGEWHVPYYGQGIWKEESDGMDFFGFSLDDALKVSTARCARVSYLTFDGKKSSMDEDIKLCEKLLASVPLHASPAEHQATPDRLITAHIGPYGECITDRWSQPHQHGNFRGWIQYRKLLPNEFIEG